MSDKRSLGDPQISLVDIMQALGAIPDPAAAYLSTKSFEEPTEKSMEAVSDSIKEFSKLDPNNVDSLFVVALIRRPNGEFCEDCGVIHENEDGKDGVSMYSALVGDSTTVNAMVDLGFRTSTEAAFKNGNFQVIEEGGDENKD